MLLYSQQKSLSVAPMGDELVMMDMSQGQYVGLDATATHIWGLLASPVGVDELVIQLMLKFDVQENDCRRDVESFLQQLVDRKLVEVNTAA
ncbi:PqqD family peptide modification chaperone [Shewanella sp. SP1S1-7]|uniref:PqqD family peptide modification chaperone n=1 Tax=Shewanella sp. SP1S1-7 TaxID=3063536 RepID=UPI0028925640|nr:PqqD family peptide modification chaperone [Shewanella sp. SP1S1-7]MDT3336883.1 PqqD family peptide modification chaperone [Shewanella sp. SP1S1-7]